MTLIPQFVAEGAVLLCLLLLSVVCVSQTHPQHIKATHTGNQVKSCLVLVDKADRMSNDDLAKLDAETLSGMVGRLSDCATKEYESLTKRQLAVIGGVLPTLQSLLDNAGPAAAHSHRKFISAENSGAVDEFSTIS